MKDHAAEVAGAAVKAVPSLTVVGATIFGYTLQEVAALAATVFVLMQMAHLGWKWRREYRDGKRK